MKICKNCGAEIADNENFCKVCGSAAEKINDDSVNTISENNTEQISEVARIDTPADVEEVPSEECFSKEIPSEEIPPEEVIVEKASSEAEPVNIDRIDPSAPVPPPAAPVKPVTPVYETKSDIHFNYEEYKAPAVDPASSVTEKPLGLGKWILTYLWLSIPIVNLIVWIVWICGGSKYTTRVNMVRGKLIFDLIVAVVLLISAIVLLIVNPNLVYSAITFLRGLISNIPMN